MRASDPQSRLISRPAPSGEQRAAGWGLGHGRIARRGRSFPPAARRPPTGRIASGRSRRNPARRPPREAAARRAPPFVRLRYAPRVLKGGPASPPATMAVKTLPPAGATAADGFPEAAAGQRLLMKTPLARVGGALGHALPLSSRLGSPVARRPTPGQAAISGGSREGMSRLQIAL